MPDSTAPELTNGFKSHLRSNRFDWLPDCDNIATMATLGTAAPAPAPSPAPTPMPTPTGDQNTTPAPTPAPCQQNPHRDPRFLGNTPFAINICTGSIRNAVAVASADPQKSPGTADCNCHAHPGMPKEFALTTASRRMTTWKTMMKKRRHCTSGASLLLPRAWSCNNSDQLLLSL